MALPVRVFAVVAKPLIIVLNGSANAFLRALGIEPQEELSGARTPQELASLVQRSAEAGTLDVTTARMLTRSLGFGERTADDVMTPRVRCTGIHREESADDVLRLSRRTGHSRFPVLGEDWDDIDGVVHVKKAMAVPHERRKDVPVSALMSDRLVVPETIRLDPLLRELREGGFQMAVVVDEYGGTSGIVTLEDVVEEIVGEVSDEHDRSRQGGRELIDGSWTVPGLWRPDEVRDAFDADVPDGSTYETMGGFVMTSLGRVPVVGDVVRLPGWRINVVGMEGRRVDRLRFVPDPESLPPARRGARRDAAGATADRPGVCRPRGAGDRRERPLGLRRLGVPPPRQRLLRRCRVRGHGGAALDARAAGRRRQQARAVVPARARAARVDARDRPARHHRVLGRTRRARRGRPAPPARADLPRRGACPTRGRAASPSRWRCSSCPTCTSSSAR